MKWILCLTMAAMLFIACTAVPTEPDADPVNANGPDTLSFFPDFITPNDDYFQIHYTAVPVVDSASFRLKVKGLIDHPRDFTLPELYTMELQEFPVTIECIGNAPQVGNLVGTAYWKGFNVYRLLSSLGLDSSATGVKYYAADGYYATHTMEQIRNNDVTGALFMNGEILPPLQGFPLRVINPGYYGVKQPAWVCSLEVIDMPPEDYWADRGWDVSPPMAINTKIFYPAGHAYQFGKRVTWPADSVMSVAGASYGGTRVQKAEYTVDGGTTWQEASIIHEMDTDYVWKFWYFEVTFSQPGTSVVNIKATDMSGNSQPETDTLSGDGRNPWQYLQVIVTE